jgi:hypothetical protein
LRALVYEENRRIIEIYKKIFLQKEWDADYVSDPFFVDGLDQTYDYVILEKSTKFGSQNLEDIITAKNPTQKILFLSPHMIPRQDDFEFAKETINLIDKPFAMINLLSQLELSTAQT